ncbi:SIS domain-containing protein [Ekhidna sp.]|uniref:SIS domain-containing protein n=1 Tax=Ekhidna sp. TaxID=2608089 RepID=UPI0032968EA6
MEKSYKQYSTNVKNVLDKIDYNDLLTIEQLLIGARDKGNKIFIFGNGGSGGNASHIAGDFVKGANYNQDKKFKFICLNDNYSALSATANDITYDEIFALQLDAFVEPEDLVIGLSGSGNSENVLRAINLANKNGAKTVGFSGYTGGKLKDIAHHSFHVPINDMEITEDLHLMAFHMIKQSIVLKQSGTLNDMGAQYKNRIT